MHFRHRYTQDCSFCVLPCCRYPQIARDRRFNPKARIRFSCCCFIQEGFRIALFGGQGTNEVYFDELQNLYDIYKPFVAPFVRTLTEDVLAPLVAEEEASTHYTFGLDVASWFSGATARPAVPISPRFPFHSLLSGLLSWFNTWSFVMSPI
jgi:hypothetical protein